MGVGVFNVVTAIADDNLSELVQEEMLMGQVIY